MKDFTIKVYRKIFCRKSFYQLNLHIYKLALRGIGILNSEGLYVSGEKYFFENIIPKLNIKTAIDVGANKGKYSLLLKKYLPRAKIYAFEPHPVTFKKLEQNVRGKRIKIFNLGFSDKVGKVKLWDFSERSTYQNSNFSSLHKDVIEKLYKGKSKSFNIKLTTIDEFTRKKNIKNIDFLKIDTEGSEYAILRGAKRMISEGKIKVILFEFNEMNVYSRVFFRDFYNLLIDYKIFRLMPDGLFSVSNYQPKIHEIFAFQNYAAFNKKKCKNLI